MSGLQRYLTLEGLVSHHVALKAAVAEQFAAALTAFMALYVLCVALSVPGAVVLTILAGVLFGPVIGSVVVVVSATIGAALVFLIARTALGTGLTRRAGPALARILEGFKADAVSYMLFLRLVPLFPFWLVNLAPALAGIALWPFVWTTLIGIIPGSVAFVLAGAGAQSVLAVQAAALEACRASATGTAAQCRVSMQPSMLVTPQLGLALGALGLVTLIPVLWRWLAKRGTNRGMDV